MDEMLAKREGVTKARQQRGAATNRCNLSLQLLVASFIACLLREKSMSTTKKCEYGMNLTKSLLSGLFIMLLGSLSLAHAAGQGGAKPHSQHDQSAFSKQH